MLPVHASRTSWIHLVYEGSILYQSLSLWHSHHLVEMSQGQANWDRDKTVYFHLREFQVAALPTHLIGHTKLLRLWIDMKSRRGWWCKREQTQDRGNMCLGSRNKWWNLRILEWTLFRKNMSCRVDLRRAGGTSKGRVRGTFCHIQAIINRGGTVRPATQRSLLTMKNCRSS